MVIEASEGGQSKRVTQDWTPDRLKYLHANVGVQPPAEMAHHLGVSPTALRHKVLREGLSLRHGEGWANIAELARQNDLSESTLLKYVNSGVIPARRVGAVWVIDYGKYSKEPPPPGLTPFVDESSIDEDSCRNCGNHLYQLVRSCSIFCEEEYVQQYYWESIFGYRGSDRYFAPHFRRTPQDFLSIEGVELSQREPIYTNYGQLATKPWPGDRTPQENAFEAILRDEFPGYLVPSDYLLQRLPCNPSRPYKPLNYDDLSVIFSSLQGKLTNPEAIYQASGGMGFAVGLSKFDISEDELKFLRQVLVRNGGYVTTSTILRNLGIKKTRESATQVVEIAEKFNDRLSSGGVFKINIKKRGRDIWKGGYMFSLRELL